MLRKIKTALAVILCVIFIASPLTGCAFLPWLSATSAPNFEELVDFVVQAEEGREFRILQLTDTQIIDPGQSRYPERIGNTTPLTDEDIYRDCFYYIEEAVERTQPDLIIMTGDIVYGEFDDNGTSLQKVVEFMESLEIPWAPVFGNHDNESMMGVTWQCQQFEEAEYCLFKRGEVMGNSNYTIGIRQGNKLVKVIYMLDSNGCGNGKNYTLPSGEVLSYNKTERICTMPTIGVDALDWIAESAQNMKTALGYVPSKFAAFHIPTEEFTKGVNFLGYTEEDEVTFADGENFGTKGETVGGVQVSNFWAIMKGLNFDGVFVGHRHLNNHSIMYQGIRLTFGTKSSTYDRHDDRRLGGTLITVAEGGEAFSVEHCLVEKYSSQ